MGELRDKIRAATVGAKKNFIRKKFEYNGLEVEFREPSFDDRKQIFAHMKDKTDHGSLTEFIIWSIIFLTYVPGTDEKVFEAGDYTAMILDPTFSGFVDKFWSQIEELTNVDLKGIQKN